MKKNFSVIEKCALFNDIDKANLEVMLDCLNAKRKVYPKQSTIFFSGDTVGSIFIVLSGNVEVIKEDFSGNRTIIASVPPGDMFGEAFACAGLRRSPVTAVATTDSEIMTVEYKRIITSCPSACSFHSKLIENMVRLIAWKNIALNSKNQILSKRTTRDKLNEYFAQQIKAQSSTSLKIPFNRNSLADYLCVDRSAMCRELCKMRDEGLISFDKSDFKINRINLSDHE